MKNPLILILSFAFFACNHGPSAKAYVAEGNKGLSHKLPYREALAAYNSAIELKPDYAVAFAGKGQLEIKMHNFFGAINDLQKAMSLDPKLTGLYYFIGYAKEQVGDHEGSQVSYTKAIELEPKNAQAYADRAFVRQILKDQDGALQDFNTALSIKPDSFADVYLARGLLKIQKNDKSSGCADLHQSLKLQPDSITRHYIEINCR
jgi:tetratricopeptide (TPR) repeat protein